MIHAFNCEVLQRACTSQTPASSTGITSTPLTYWAGIRIETTVQSNPTTCNLHEYSTMPAASDDLKKRKSQQCCLNFKHLKIFVLGNCPESPLIYTAICKLLPAELDVSGADSSSGPAVLYKPHVCNLISFQLPKEKGILKKKKKKKCCNFLACILAWCFESTGRIPAITFVRKKQKITVSVKILIFFSTRSPNCY